ncbi:hypothetical protein LIER_03065 [Lithospermum erythrorhizon]|uniref:Uncharacterized protein n=1 Tax=Lithospermum erythrorhizon TaxID=34254 RepID=A0AAV3NVP7_LITER
MLDLGAPSARYRVLLEDARNLYSLMGLSSTLQMLSFNLEKETWKLVALPSLAQGTWEKPPSFFDFDGFGS